MKVILATSNRGKIKELENLLPQFEVITYEKLLGKLNIIENGDSFKQNAIIKAKAIYDKLDDKDVIVISDDSGISLPVLNNAPGIYSARYFKEGATDEQNNSKLIEELKKRNIDFTDAFYTAAIAIVYKDEIYTTHGWMYGKVGIESKGDAGFGYDPLFIPNGFDKTLGELPSEIKKSLSHRTKALNLAIKLLDTIL